MAYQMLKQLNATNVIRLFEGSGGFEAGAQQRDFIFVADVVAINLFFADGNLPRGIFNVGTGQSQSFNDMAQILIALHGSGEIQYIPFPEGLREKYQSFTRADISSLQAAGYDSPFTSLTDGLTRLYQSQQRSLRN
jgi:ADP-L-glycero-D-manno-heptose 6-epimerase